MEQANRMFPDSWIADREEVRVDTIDGRSHVGRIASPISFQHKIVKLYDGDSQFINRFIPFENVVMIERLERNA